MSDTDAVTAMKDILRHRPGHSLVLPSGDAIALLVNDRVILMTAPFGKNFNDMTDDEINSMIVNRLM